MHFYWLVTFQEDELDDLASQVQLLEQSKAKLESSLSSLRKEHRREMSEKEDELDDVRAAHNKKVKALEHQLEQEHEDRVMAVREKKDLEAKINGLKEIHSRWEY